MRPTPRGIAVLVAALALYAAGELLGLAALRALAGCAIGALLVAVAPVWGRIRPDVSRAVHPDRVQCGDPATAELVVTNPGTRRLPAFTARDVVGADAQLIAVRSLPDGGVARHHYPLPTARRGLVDVGPLVLERSDLLGLARSRTELGAATRLWVHPRRHAVLLPGAGRARPHHEGDPPPFPVRGSMDLRALREYVVGDEPRHLHWKASARTGQLMVREYVDPAQPWTVVVLDTRASALDTEAFEQAVSVAASVLWASCAQNRPARLCTTAGLRVDTAGGASALREVLDPLCTVTQGPDETVDLADPGGGRGEGWFVHAGGVPSATVLATARRFGRSLCVDLSGVDGPAHGGLHTIRSSDASTALQRWNASAAAAGVAVR